MELTCPKCHGTMRTYERNGVHVDQCTECRGIFLDRGELERLIDAENDWHERPRERSGPSSQPHGGSGYASTGSSGGLGGVVNEGMSQVGKSRSSHGSSGHGYSKKRKESFLGDLFG
jgi:uncharacterized protein